MNSILIPVNPNGSATGIISFAVDIAAQMGARLVLYHQFQVDFPAGANQVAYYRAIDEQRTRAEDFFTSVVAMFKKRKNNNFHMPEFEIAIEHSKEDWASGILKVVGKMGVGMLVLPSQVKTGVEILFQMQTMEKLVQKVALPVLVVPQNCCPIRLKQVVFASDFVESETEVLDVLHRFCGKILADIKCLHVQTTHEEKNLSTIKDNIQIDTYAQKDIVLGIDEYLKMNEVDILAVVIHERGFLSKVFQKSHAERLAGTISTPLLILKQDKKGVKAPI